jgi:formylglycine-generating enzyme required for sulfatase activity
MDDWKGILTELAKKLTPALAFAVLMYWLVAVLGDQIPPAYQAIPYILIVGGFIVYAVVAIVQARSKHQSAGQGNVEIGQGVQGSVINTGKNNQINNIINHYAQANPGINKVALHAQIAGYLAWAEETFGKITLRGIEQSGRQVVELPLDTVYVPLQAEYNAQRDEFSPERMQSKDAEEHSTKVALNQILGLNQRLIITGSPGSGKTTVLQHIAWTLAHAIYRDQESVAQKKLGLELPLPLPIYVPLSLYAAYRRKLPENAPGQKKTLAAFIADYLLQNQTNLELNSDFFADLLRDEQRVLLLLDGFDEVPDESERIIVRQDIEHLVSGKANLRVVVTSRTAAYQGRAVLGRGFQQVSVLPIGDDQIKSMIEQAYRAIYSQTLPQARVKAGDLLKGIQRLEAERRQRLGKDIQSLVATPLMVRMLLIVHFNNRRLPDQRADLYQKAVDAMLRPDYSLDESVSEEIERRVGGSLAINREMLQLLAFHMHQRGGEQGREIGEPALRNILCSDPNYEPFVDDLITQTCQRGTLLEERGGMYRFIHLSFQEFLTGRYLVERLRELEKIAAFLEDGPILEDWWREPILLMIGYLDITSPRLAGEMLTRLAGLDAEAEEKIAKLPIETQLAASEIAAVAYQECQNKAPALQGSLKKRLHVFLQPEIQVKAFFSPPTLASVADTLDRFDYLPADLYEFVAVSSEQETFCIGRYPVTNAQYQRFLEAPDFGERDYWVDFPKFDEPKKNYTRVGNWGEESWAWLQKNWDENKKKYPRYWDEVRFGIARLGVPVVGITWYEANAYCKWLLVHWDELLEGEQNPEFKPGLIRLPTEAEWIAAAGGAEPADRCPWDAKGAVTQEEAEIQRRANVDESKIGRTTPVSMYPLGVSPIGVWDMGGNVFEWQANFADKYHDVLTIRGGSWSDLSNYVRLSRRSSHHPYNGWCYGGFRVVALPSGRS